MGFGMQKRQHYKVDCCNILLVGSAGVVHWFPPFIIVAPSCGGSVASFFGVSIITMLLPIEQWQ
jgi:hypothetical protein